MRTPLSESSFLSQIKAYFSGDLPQGDDLSVARRVTLKGRILAKITSTMSEQHLADALNDRIVTPQVSRDFFGFLARVAHDVQALPKVSPRVAWRERVRAEFGLFAPLSWWTLLTRAAAFAVVVIMVGSVTLLSFVAQSRETLAEVARIDLTSGVVKIRAADDVFYTTAKTGDSVHVGDIVRVESAGSARIAFHDRSTLDLAEKTEIAITNPKPETLALANTPEQVKVAVLSGSVSAKVSQVVRSSAFAIETSKGTVEAKENAEVAVSVSPTGTTEVTTGSGDVSLTPTDAAISTDIAVGTRATLAESNTVVLEVVKVEPAPVVAVVKPVVRPIIVDDGFDALVVDVDILKTRSFDALSLVENGDALAASRSLITLAATLTNIAKRIEVAPDASTAEITAAIANKYAKRGYASVVRDLEIIALTREAATAAVNQPLLRRGVPEFVLATNHRYAPPAELRKLFAVLALRNFAAPDVAAYADRLSAIVIPGYAREFARTDAAVWLTNLLAGMGDEPVYLPALRTLLADSPTALQPAIAEKITALEKTLAEYVGR